MLLFKDRTNEMASESTRGDGSRTRKFLQQGKGARSPASLLLQQLAGYSDHQAVGKRGLEAVACELAEHLVDCQAVVLPHVVQQAQGVVLCRERERHKPTVGSSPFVPSVTQRCLAELQQFAPCPAAGGYSPAGGGCPTCTMILSLEAAS